MFRETRGQRLKRATSEMNESPSDAADRMTKLFQSSRKESLLERGAESESRKSFNWTNRYFIVAAERSQAPINAVTRHEQYERVRRVRPPTKQICIAKLFRATGRSKFRSQRRVSLCVSPPRGFRSLAVARGQDARVLRVSGRICRAINILINRTTGKIRTLFMRAL